MKKIEEWTHTVRGEVPSTREGLEALAAKVVYGYLNQNWRYSRLKGLGSYLRDSKEVLEVRAHYLVERTEEDASLVVTLLEVVAKSDQEKVVVRKTDEYLTWNHEYWEDLLANAGDRAVVVDGVHYCIGEKLVVNQGRSTPGAGFGGRQFTITWLDGEREPVKTNNLWYQGKIPPQIRDRMPDNATLEWKW